MGRSLYPFVIIQQASTAEVVALFKLKIRGALLVQRQLVAEELDPCEATLQGGPDVHDDISYDHVNASSQQLSVTLVMPASSRLCALQPHLNLHTSQCTDNVLFRCLMPLIGWSEAVLVVGLGSDHMI